MSDEKDLQTRNLLLGHEKAPGIIVEVDPGTGQVITPMSILREMAATVAENTGHSDVAAEIRSWADEKRFTTHYDALPHGNCLDPTWCNCECNGCIRVWIQADRPGPPRSE